MAGADNIRFYTTDHMQRPILDNDTRRHVDVEDDVHATAAVAQLEEVDQHPDQSLVQQYGAATHDDDDAATAAAANSVAGAAAPVVGAADNDDVREYNFYGRKRSWAAASGANTSAGGRRYSAEVSGPAPAMEVLPPGFRFHPTDEELVVHYLRNKVAARPLPVPIIADIDLYKFDPWDLPGKAICGENEWYFFTPRDRKYPNGARPNRAAGSGYWKATGTDKPIMLSTTSDPRNQLNQQHINPILTNSPSWSSTAAAAPGVPNRSSSSTASSAAGAGIGLNNNINGQNSAHCSCCCTGSSSIRHLPCLNAGHVAGSPTMTATCTKPVGVKKALVFYRGRPPKGLKTNWIMHEYRLAEAGNPSPTAATGGSHKHGAGVNSGSASVSGFYSRRTLRLDDWVLCRIYRKNTQNHEQPYIQVRSDSNSCIDEVFPNISTSDRLQLNDEANKVIKFQQYSGTRQPSQLGSFGRLVMSGSSMLPNVNLLENFVVDDRPCTNTSTEQIVNSWGISTSFNSTSMANVNGAHPLFVREHEYGTKRNTLPATIIPNNIIPNNYNMQGIPNILSSMNALHHYQQHSNEGISREPETSNSEVIYDNNNLRWALENRTKYPYT